MTAPRRLIFSLAAAASAALVLTSCAGSSQPAASGSSDSGVIQVVTSTNVYGQIAQEIGGDAVQVTPIITSSAQDPHEYEATAQDQLTISEADLLIENGAGYDAFMDSMIESTGTTAPVITAVEFNSTYPGAEGHDHTDGATPAAGEDGHEHLEGFNEHVWYDPHTMEHFAQAIADELSTLSPANAATFSANAATFIDQVAGLETSLEAIAATDAGAGVFVTEPVPVYLTTAAGMTNVTPEAFSEAVEEGQDVPPATLLEALNLINGGSVRVVIVNAQTGGAETTQIIDAAKAKSIPVLEFTETLPEGQTYISWMKQNIAELQEALAQ